MSDVEDHCTTGNAGIATAASTSENTDTAAMSERFPPTSPPRDATITSSSSAVSSSSAAALHSMGQQQQQQLAMIITTPKVQDDDDYLCFEQQTPPAFSPLPVMVSAKRLGKEVRRNHSKRRRLRSFPHCGKENHDAATATDASCWALQECWSSTAASPTSDDDNESATQYRIRQGLSPEELAKHYWNLCYGAEPLKQQSLSATRAPPVKSCLSSTKKRNNAIVNITIQTPTIYSRPNHHSITISNPNDIAPLSAYSTPSPGESLSPAMTPSRKVQFGHSMAAEFIAEEPTGALTPMPIDVARERFPIEQKNNTQEELAETAETKCNTSILSEWEQDFDELIKDDDDEELEAMLFTETTRRNKRNGTTRRRDSTVFTPSPGSKGLLQDDIEGMPPAMVTSLQMDSPMAEQHETSPTRQLDVGFQQCSENVMERLINRQKISAGEALTTLASRGGTGLTTDLEEWNNSFWPVRSQIYDCLLTTLKQWSMSLLTVEPKGILLKNSKHWKQAEQITIVDVERLEQAAFEKVNAQLKLFATKLDREFSTITNLLTLEKTSLKRQIDQEEAAIARLEQQVVAAQQTKEHARIVLEYPWCGLAYFATRALFPFKLQMYQAEYFKVAFPHELLGLETTVCCNLTDSSYNIQVHTIKDVGAPASLFRALFCITTIRNMISKSCQSVQEFLNRFGTILGRIELVGTDVSLIRQRPFVQSTIVITECNKAIKLIVGMDHDIQLHLVYDRTASFPRGLTVFQNGKVNAELDNFSLASMSKTACSGVGILQKVCDGIHKAMLQE